MEFMFNVLKAFCKGMLCVLLVMVVIMSACWFLTYWQTWAVIFIISVTCAAYESNSD